MRVILIVPPLAARIWAQWPEMTVAEAIKLASRK